MIEQRGALTKKLLARAAVIFLLTRLVVFGAAYSWLFYDAAKVELGPREPIWHGDAGGHGFAAEPWRRWDALWFVKTAREGYSFIPGRQSNTTIFPLYPALMAAGAKAGLDLVWAGVIISNLCLFWAAVFMLSLVDKQCGKRTSGRSVAAMLLFPSAFVFSGVYSESLFLVTTLGAFYFAGERRWFLAGLFGLGASLTRFTGAAVFIPLAMMFFDSYKRDGERPLNALWLMTILAGPAMFFAYLQIETGSYMNYFNSQAHWQKTMDWPWVGLGWEIVPWYWGPNQMLNAGAFFLFAALCRVVWKKYGAVWGVYMFIGLLMPACASRWIGMPRYVMVLFPAFAAIAELLKSKWLFWAYLAASGAGLVWLFGQFLNWRISL